MLDINIGDKVHYQPSYYRSDNFENGIVKEITTKGIRVVYNCAGDWDNYMDYTSALTDISDLKIGWL